MPGVRSFPEVSGFGRFVELRSLVIQATASARAHETTHKRAPTRARAGPGQNQNQNIVPWWEVGSVGIFTSPIAIPALRLTLCFAALKLKEFSANLLEVVWK